jgi:hypothetical protein
VTRLKSARTIFCFGLRNTFVQADASTCSTLTTPGHQLGNCQGSETISQSRCCGISRTLLRVTKLEILVAGAEAALELTR